MILTACVLLLFVFWFLLGSHYGQGLVLKKQYENRYPGPKWKEGDESSQEETME